MSSIPPPKPPSFFKIMFNDFDKNMRIPPAFMKNFRKGSDLEVSDGFKLKCGEKSWCVASERKKDGCFLVSGWPKFAKDQNLEMGDFLIFRLVKKSVFEVDVYGTSCCEKVEKIPPLAMNADPRVQSPVEKLEISNSGKGLAGKSRKPEGVSGTAAKRPKKSPEKTEVEPEARKSFSVEVVLKNKFRVLLPNEFIRKTGLRSRSNIVIKDTGGRKQSVMIYVPEKGSAALSTGWKKVFEANKLKIGETILLKLHGGGDEIELQIPKSPRKPNSDAPVKRAKTPPKKDSGLQIVEKGRRRGPNSDENVGMEMKIPKEEEEIVAEVNCSSSVKLVTKSHNRYRMPLPIKFARETGLISKERITVKDNEGRRWTMGVIVAGKKGQVVFATGWREFCKANRLGVRAAVLLKFDGGDELDVEVLNRGIAPFLYRGGRPPNGNATVSV